LYSLPDLSAPEQQSTALQLKIITANGGLHKLVREAVDTAARLKKLTGGQRSIGGDVEFALFVIQFCLFRIDFGQPHIYAVFYGQINTTLKGINASRLPAGSAGHKKQSEQTVFQ
jgi:hypothetical protein